LPKNAHEFANNRYQVNVCPTSSSPSQTVKEMSQRSVSSARASKRQRAQKNSEPLAHTLLKTGNRETHCKRKGGSTHAHLCSTNRPVIGLVPRVSTELTPNSTEQFWSPKPSSFAPKRRRHRNKDSVYDFPKRLQVHRCSFLASNHTPAEMPRTDQL